jgi:hypothetical protein
MPVVVDGVCTCVLKRTPFSEAYVVVFGTGDEDNDDPVSHLRAVGEQRDPHSHAGWGGGDLVVTCAPITKSQRVCGTFSLLAIAEAVSTGRTRESIRFQMVQDKTDSDSGMIVAFFLCIADVFNRASGDNMTRLRAVIDFLNSTTPLDLNPYDPFDSSHDRQVASKTKKTRAEGTSAKTVKGKRARRDEDDDDDEEEIVIID